MKCGHKYCPGVKCGVLHPFNKKKRNSCNSVVGCINDRCQTLKAYGDAGFTLFDACVGHCNGSSTDATYPQQYQNTTEYACAVFDPGILVDFYGVNPCDIDMKDTITGKITVQEEKLTAESNKTLLWVGGIAGIALLIYLLK
jgi:hypothetical protein